MSIQKFFLNTNLQGRLLDLIIRNTHWKTPLIIMLRGAFLRSNPLLLIRERLMSFRTIDRISFRSQRVVDQAPEGQVESK